MELKCTRISCTYKACWVKPDDAKNNEFKEFKRIKQKFLQKINTDNYFFVDSDFTTDDQK
jgi:peptide chain release factor 3